MEVEERVDLIEGEVTLIKGEIKQALIELRELVTNRPIRGPESDVQRIEIHQTSEITQSSEVHQSEGTSEENAASGAPSQVEEEQPSSEIDQDQPPDEVGEEDAGSLSQSTGGLEVGQQPGPGNGGQPPGEGSLEPESSIFDLVPGQNQPTSQELPPSSQPSEFDEATLMSTLSSRPVPEVRALDIHSVANVMRWVGAVRPRIGEEQLGTLLEVYTLAGHLPATIEQLILQAGKLNALPEALDDQGFALEDFIDSLLKLHAIVSGLDFRPGSPLPDSAQPLLRGNGAQSQGGSHQELESLVSGLSGDQDPQPSTGLSGLQRYARIPDTAGRRPLEAGTLDANLVANLMRWACTVRASVGQDQLEALLEVYQLTGNLPSRVERLVLKAAQLQPVMDQSASQGYTQRDFIDSLLKLHGIVHSTGYQPGGPVREFERPPTIPKDRYG